MIAALELLGVTVVFIMVILLARTVWGILK